MSSTRGTIPWEPQRTLPALDTTRSLRILMYGLAPTAAAGAGSLHLSGDVRFWNDATLHLPFVITSGLYALSLVAYWAVRRTWCRRVRIPRVRDTMLRAACMLVGAGVALISGLGHPTGASGSTSAILWGVLSLLMVAAPSQPASKRIGLIASGRLAELRRLRLPDVEIVVVDRPGPVRSFDEIAADLHHDLPDEWREWLADWQLRGRSVQHVGLLYERLTGKVSLRYCREGAIHGQDPAAFEPLTKRVVEFAFIVVTAPVLVPLMLLVALAVRAESAGPVLFWQERLGRDGRTFRMAKFRSMVAGADASGAKFAAEHDPRVTRVGGFIRRLRLDELPQLYNVLRGEMSLIGPRPEQVAFAERFTEEIPFYSTRHRVRPGITGWAQVRNGYAAGVDETTEKLTYDLYYVKYMSLRLDAIIAWHTVRTILTGAGAR